jgi:surface polysaccharide O-acyltransferase-like enzyme
MTDTQNIQTTAKPVIQWVDMARSLGAFLVVLAHINGWADSPRYAASFYYTISRIGVPIFFLISGYLLLSKEEDIVTFFKKRAAKILIPFFVWSSIYDMVNTTHFFSETGASLNAVMDMFLRILRGPREGHLWFFYSLIGLYLLVPILRVFVARAKPTELFYYIALWFIAMPVLFILEAFTPIKNGFEIYYTGGYVGYFLLGYYLGGMGVLPTRRNTTLGLFAAGFIFSFIVFYFDLPPLDNEMVFRSYPSFNIILMSLGAFVMIKYLGERTPPALARFSGRASQYGFGIYLVHPLILKWMMTGWRHLGFDPQSGSSVIVIPVVAVIAFLLSWGCAYLISRIPILRAIV